MEREPLRHDGYAPIRDYAAVGDGRTVALVALDGSVDWLCLPDLDAPAALAALLDAERGGRFALSPTAGFAASRRYVPGTNVLETTFTTAGGAVRVTDALTLPASGLAPYRELVRKVEGLSGRVPLDWTLEPRAGYGAAGGRLEMRAGVPTFSHRRDALALVTWGAGEPVVGGGRVTGRFEAAEGSVAHLVLAAAHQEPLVYPAREQVVARLAATLAYWRTWADGRTYDGPWRDAVLRSALALKLLVFAPSGAIAAAPTTSLPEAIGGERNWGYRYSWPRDAAFALRALLALGCDSEAHAFFSWLMHASQLTAPEVRVLYRLNGRADTTEEILELGGYRRSRPVRAGNAAGAQTQLDVYGEILDAAVELARHARALDRDQAKRLARLADHVCRSWSEPDAGIWESRGPPRHYTQSKLMCAVALDRACALSEQGLVRGDAARWSTERDRVREFVETRCWSDAQRSYTQTADGESLDASLLLGVTARYAEPGSPRLVGTVEAIRRGLARGPLVRRHLAGEGDAGDEGAFVACSFWLAEALARQGRLDEARGLMDELLPLANDVGLYAEELDPESGDFLGNFPQALSHLALINAAVTIAGADS
jgi:GH15 family glucan-1,4-alpha-glucosidase